MHNLPGAHGEAGEMPVKRADAVSVVDRDGPPVPVHHVGELDHTIRRRYYPGADLTGDIDTAMERTLAAEGVNALTERSGDAPLHRPQGWRRRQAHPIAQARVMQFTHADADRGCAVHRS